MDFMKILLAYMATTLIVAVESTATPSVTPVPTPGAEATPTAIVTEAPAEITAEPTVSVTPVPVPTISPNPKYHNLAQGDRGEDVRKLQERLIELGYLPEGSADGAYGGQTRNAVRRFQYYNSLQVDGIAGRATQTNLFENPDVMPYPQATADTPAPETTAAVTSEDMTTETPADVPTEEPVKKPTEEPTEKLTEKPTEAPTAEPTETPTEAPTDEPTEMPTEEPTETPTETPAEEPTEAPTEEPTETPAEKPTEAPAEKPTEAPAEKPTEAPTDEPTETPAETTPAGTPEVEVTEAPAGPTEIIENVDLEDEYEDLAGWIVLNDSGAAMQWNALLDGVTVLRYPRMQIREDRIRISLDDAVQCVNDWTLTDDGDTVVLEAEGYTLGLFNEEAGFAATVDGMEIETDPFDFDFVRDGHFMDVDFLTRALNGTWQWDTEEWTLMLRIPGKSVINATD